MYDQEGFLSALVNALAQDSSEEALRRAIAAVRVAYEVSPRRAYAILVRASAGCPGEVTGMPRVPAQREAAAPPLSDTGPSMAVAPTGITA